MNVFGYDPKVGSRHALYVYDATDVMGNDNFSPVLESFAMTSSL